MKFHPLLRIGLLLYSLSMLAKFLNWLPPWPQCFLTGFAAGLIICGAFAPRLQAFKLKLLHKNKGG